MTRRRCAVSINGQTVDVEIDDDPPLGWRFWTFAGFPQDPIEPRPYGGARGLVVAPIETQRGSAWLVAMELDDSAQVMTAHELFPCADQEGAAEFGRRWTEGRANQPRLF